MNLCATYRIQLRREFTFHDLERIVPYLRDLGISHLYLSPVMEAMSGSAHGYDVRDFSRISEERGGVEGFRALMAAVRAAGLHVVLDIVPNHMAASPLNPFWRDLLKNGPCSRSRKLFDLKPEPDGRVRLPILGGDLPDALERGEIGLREGDEGYEIVYSGTAYPLSGESLKAGALAALLDRQHYRLVCWKEALSHVSYRRFFNISDLVGVRVEDRAVYEETHAALFSLLRAFPEIDGLRVDHIDGLADPGAYLDRLAEQERHIWVEKILTRRELLPGGWPVCGTTGYEFIDLLNFLFVDGAGFAALEREWKEQAGGSWPDFPACVLHSKAEVLEKLFGGELSRLAELSAAEEEKRGRAAAFWRGLVAALPVYRTYREAGAAFLPEARRAARRHFGAAYADAEEEFLPLLSAPETGRIKKIADEWRQLSGPVMAKGLEDTAHYRYTPLAALNEVGCAVPAEDFAAGDFVTSLQERARHWPWAMNATSTHDTKRSEDARHRLYALADAPGLWRAYYEDARRLNQKFNPGLRGATEHFLYQAILAIWPLEGGPDAAFRQRIAGYMRKACREARLETDWLAPDEAYEARLDRFIAQILAHGPFLDRTTRLMEKLMPWGALASLSVQCLKILSPGVPDFYQGTEIWDFSLVDPDNRRPVDYARRQALAEELALLEKAEGRKALSARLCRVWKDGAVKLWLTRRLLRIRAGRLLPAAPPWPLSPLAAEGDMARALIAYEIGDLFVLCPRYPGLLWPEALSGAPLRVPPRRWGDTRVRMPERAQGKALVNLITGEMAAGSAGFAVSGLLANFPVAVLAAGNE